MIRSAIPSPTTPGRFAVARSGDAIATTLECDGFVQLAAAQGYADGLNAAYARQEAAAAITALPPAERPIAKGFYDQD